MYLALKTKSDHGLLKRLFFWLTKWRLLTDFPHAGIVVGGMLLHTNLANGLHTQAFEPEGWLLLDIGGNHARVLDLYDEHEGTAYDWFSLLAFVLPWNVRDGDRMYCYEWCWLAMTGHTPRGRVTPEMLLTLAHQIETKKETHG